MDRKVDLMGIPAESLFKEEVREIKKESWEIKKETKDDLDFFVSPEWKRAVEFTVKQENEVKAEKDSAAAEIAVKCEIEEEIQVVAGPSTARETKKKHALYTCKICTAPFASASLLLTHMHIHAVDKPHYCYVCGRIFPAGGNLYEHMRVHANVKPFQCDECSECFAESAALTRHKHLHLHAKHFVCHLCPMFFSEKAQLADHLGTHTGEKTSGKPFHCTLCLKNFSRMYYLRAHYRNVHKLNEVV